MSKQLPLYVGLTALLVVSFLVLDGPYGYLIAYQSETNDCFFMFGRQFLLEFFDYPAGALRYAGRFLGQFYYWTWLAALIVSACIACFGALFYGVLAKLKREAGVFQALFPCILLLALHTSPLYVIQDTLGLCASCGMFLGYLWFRSKAARRLYAFAATPFLYLLLGFYVWFFVVWVAISEWLDGPARSGLFFKIAHVAVSISVPLVAWRWVFLIPLRVAFACPLLLTQPFRSGLLEYSGAHLALDRFLVLSFCAWVLLIPFWGGTPSNWRIAARWRAWPARAKRAALAAVLCGFATVLHVARYDEQLSTFVECRQLYKSKRWDALLEATKENRLRDLRLQFMTNYALAQKGTLLDEMFKYPQGWGPRGLVFNYSGVGHSATEDDTDLAVYNSDLFYEMGHVNFAFKHVYNFMSARGNRYDILKRMAQCGAANGNYDMAAKYLSMLEKTLFHRDFARRYRAILADANAIEREFGQLRRLLPVVDDERSFHPAAPFDTLLQSNPGNRLALDYLTAWCLLDKASVARLPTCLGGFKAAGYASLPAHCQEALLLWERLQRTRVDLQGFAYDSEIKARVETFLKELERRQSRLDAPQQMQPAFGDTYMFYFCFVATPGAARGPMPESGGLRRE